MSSLNRRFLAAGLCVAGASAWAGAASRADEPKASAAVAVSQKQVEALARPVVDGDWCAGMVVAVVDPQGTKYYGFGSSGLATALPDERTLFEIGSISKAFTGVLLADAVVRKEVALEDPISRYLPEKVKAPEYQGTPITLLNLSTHTASLPRLPGNLRPKDPANPYADYTVEQLYDFLSSYRLPRKPGEKSDYSNLGTGLLGHLLARRAGKSYEELLVERVCRPLGLADTRISLNAEQRGRLARGHGADGEPAANWDLPTFAGAGAVRSSAADMARFVQANLNPTGSPLGEALRLSHVPRFVVGGETSIGLGWHLNTQSKTVWHNGETGGYHSFAGFIPERHAGVVVLANSATELVDAVGVSVLRIQEGLAPVPPKLQPTLKLEAKALEPYVGRYTLAPGAILTVTRTGAQLKAQLTGQPAFKIYPKASNEFYYRVVDAQLTFEKDKDSQVTAVVLHQNGQNLKAPRAK
jgi:CubicO group peptidase (beta-lactamase class C family)